MEEGFEGSYRRHREGDCSRLTWFIRRLFTVWTSDGTAFKMSREIRGSAFQAISNKSHLIHGMNNRTCIVLHDEHTIILQQEDKRWDAHVHCLISHRQDTLRRLINLNDRRGMDRPGEVMILTKRSFICPAAVLGDRSQTPNLPQHPLSLPSHTKRHNFQT